MSRQKTGIRLNYTDFYPTPFWCYCHLEVDWKQFKTAHEPCAGDGRIVGFLEDRGLNVSYSEITQGKDFFEWNGNVDLILTNPPFSLAQEFIEHSIPRAEVVIMLLRLNFLASQKRYPFWKQYNPSALYVLSKRPSFTGKGTDACDYAWFVWQKEEIIKPGIYFVSP